jgi:hypothetical protein
MATAIPTGAYLKDVSCLYNHLTLPRHLRLLSPLEPELWGRVAVREGAVDLFLEGQREPLRCLPGAPGIIPADTPFRLEGAGQPVRFLIEYWHEPRLKDEGELTTLLASSAADRQRAGA